MGLGREESAEVLVHPSSPYGETNVGKRRKTNEDSLIVFDSRIKGNPFGKLKRVFAVADGVAGKYAGEVAANSVVLSIYREAREQKRRNITPQDLESYDRAIPAGATTLVMAQNINSGNSFEIFNVGDSSALIIDSRRKTVKEITKRHETYEGKVTQVMGPEGRSVAPLRNPDIRRVNLEPGQTLLLASDGFTKYIDSGQIKARNLLTVRKTFENDNKSFVKELISMTNICGGADNITIIAIPYDKTLR